MDSLWRAEKRMAGAGCSRWREAFRKRWPATRLTEGLEEPSLPQSLGHAACRRTWGLPLPSEVRPTGPANGCCFKWKFDPFCRTLQSIVLPPLGSPP